MLLKKWILCLAFFGGLHQAVSAVHNDQLVISLESYQLTLLGLPQEILLDHNFKKEIDVVVYLATHQLGQERITTVIQILSADYGSSIDNLTTFIQAALKKFTLLSTERNQLLFTLLFMTSLLKQHAHVPLTRNLSVSEFHLEFHTAAAAIQQEFQTTAEQLKQFLPPPRKSWLKKALTYTVIGAAAFTVWWFLTRSSREEPIVHDKREAASEAVPALVDVPALVAGIVDRLNDVEHGIEAGFGRIHAAHAELAAATHAAIEHGIEHTDAAIADARGELSEQIAQLQALHEQLTADLARHTTAEAAARVAAIEAVRGELATEREAREGAIAAEVLERANAMVAERERNDAARVAEGRRVDTGLQALDRRILATVGTVANHTRDLDAMRERLAHTEEDAAARRHEISAQGHAIAANERSVRPHIDEAARAREEHNAAQQSSRSIIHSVAGSVGTVVGVIAAAATTNPATVFFIGAEGTRVRFDETRRAVHSKCTEIGDAAKERLAPLRPDLPHYNVGREPYVPPAAAPANPVA